MRQRVGGRCLCSADLDEASSEVVVVRLLRVRRSALSGVAFDGLEQIGTTQSRSSLSCLDDDVFVFLSVCLRSVATVSQRSKRMFKSKF